MVFADCYDLQDIALCYHVQQDEVGEAVHRRGSVSTVPPSAILRSPQLSKLFLFSVASLLHTHKRFSYPV